MCLVCGVVVLWCSWFVFFLGGVLLVVGVDDVVYEVVLDDVVVC